MNYLSNTNGILAKAFQNLIDTYGLVSEGDKRFSEGAVGSVNWDNVRVAPLMDVAAALRPCGCHIQTATFLQNILKTVWEEGKQRRKQNREKEALTRASVRAARIKTGEIDSDSELTDLSDSEHDGELSLEYMRNYSSDDALNRLQLFGGIGPKAAACVVMFCG